MAYRFGAFHALSDVAYRKLLPSKVIPAQVRCALTAVINRQINAPGHSIRKDGCGSVLPVISLILEKLIFLQVVCIYVLLYLLPLVCRNLMYIGLPATAWTCKKGWEGIDLDVDKALKK